MSRSNPYKKKRRVAKTTLLVYGEGMGEEMFLKYLRSIYAHNSTVHVTIKKGKGGTATAVVIDASNTEGAYDKKVVVLDCDKGAVEMENARREALIRGIELIENKPCLEALLLSILLPNQNYQNVTSLECKRRFERKYISKGKRSDLLEYHKIFPRDLLEERRAQLKDLQVLILLMEMGG